MASREVVVWIVAGAVFVWLALTEIRQLLRDRRSLAMREAAPKGSGEAKVTDEKKFSGNFINIGTMTGGTVSPVYNNFQTIVAPGRVELSDVGVKQLADTLRGKHVTTEIIGADQKSITIASRLIERLSALGIDAGRPSITGLKIPPPSDPYSVLLSQDGKHAQLTISPSTLP